VDKIKLLVADDHPIFREGLCRLLEDEEGIEVIAKVGSGEEAVRAVMELSPHVAIIDVVMPGIGGIEAAKQTKAASPQTAILMLSAYAYGPYILASLHAGAAGYLLKSSSPGELAEAIRLAHAGDAVFNFRATNKALSKLLTGEALFKNPTGILHSRELQILRLVARGMSNKEIAGELVISERTVRTHMVNIFRKLQVSSRTEAVLHALKEGWLTLDNLP